MNKIEFKKILAERIDPEEERMLRSQDPGLDVSDFNRGVCLRVLDEPADEDGKEIDESLAKELEESLCSFLDEYMSDRPEAHKWIILACLELAFVEEIPMHPQTSAHWVYENGEYLCPGMVEDSIICRCCACRKLEGTDEKGKMCCAK